ncbi:hypothetical protein E1292_22370 [Nonomuraea deserti]|uniref:Uncharacterized protein n=1 Tax=Nonomuraea deserti TaxID=1848322 RepID=A0A4R4VKX6_9ACTN|nr:hypothetical protein [Nonomuraea deserti]TDD02974.1 hypothetical protein E1292_22370 [Nonomuraea deserti]
MGRVLADSHRCREGNRRNLVGDRLEIIGARWGLAGAEAILKLRAVIANNNLDQYWAFHIDRESHRVRQSRQQDGYTFTA